MKISEGGREGVFLLKEWTTHSLNTRRLVLKKTVFLRGRVR